ncbi:hypothetical protein [Massilia sp. erpn]|uniref:hypothetical protein n=1 Tax=Massilia sp. erpn TaxID=2738142 RepID=UPI002107558D|nr:hypothetical protein [Massilia sp. erpn]UTY57079.1 hypothetical protein HPQ68_07660 [Massilia sp. erpn]
MDIKVSSLIQLKRSVAEFEPTHIISVLDPDFAACHPLAFGADVKVHHAHFYDDDDLARQTGSVEAHLAPVLQFLRQEVLSSDSHRLLVHCHAGASRSPAIAFMTYCLALGCEVEAFEQLLKICNKPWPSENVVKIADQMLDRKGRMIAALQAYRANCPRRFEAYQRLNRRRNLFVY